MSLRQKINHVQFQKYFTKAFKINLIKTPGFLKIFDFQRLNNFIKK